MLPIDNIPIELKSLKRWIYYTCHKKSKPKFVNGIEKLDKVPSNFNGKKVDATISDNWQKFNTVAEYYYNNEDNMPLGHGVGFVFNESDGYVGIDVDSCVKDGVINNLGREIIDLMRSYTEFSISGTGIHIIVKARNLVLKRHKNTPLDIEIYNKGRFFTMCGNIVPGCINEIFERTEEVNTFINKYLPSNDEQSPALPLPSAGDDTLTVEDVIKRVMEVDKKDKFKKLFFDGDITAYNNDHSAADGALVMLLAFYTNRNAKLMDAVFRQSKLMRPKWDEMRGACTYGQYQITNAIVECKKVYEPKPPKPPKPPKEPKPVTMTDVIGLIWDISNNGYITPSYRNCCNYFKKEKTIIRFNDFDKQYEIDGERLSDNHLYSIKLKMVEFGFEPAITIIDEAIKSLALENSYHPVKDYIFSLKWDGVERLNRWLIDACGANDNAMSMFVSRTIFLAIINRIFRPGCQYDYMPVLEGDQGIGKSSIVRVIGGQWYKEVSLTEKDKDTIQKMQGAIIIEVAELAAFSKRDIDSLKAFITQPVDFCRFAYGRNDHKYPRQSTFIGTINPDEVGYLNDTTGNRRFLPVLITTVDLVWLINNRDQLFAEAYQMYLKGVKIYIDNKTEKVLASLAREHQEEREVIDPWLDEIRNWASLQTAFALESVTCTDIYVEAIKGDLKSCSKRETVRIANCLKRLGASKSFRKTVNKKQQRCYDLSFLLSENNKNDENIDYTD